MTGLEGDAAPRDGRGAATERVRIECKADRRVHGLDVEWMKGAVFEFDSLDDAEAWVAQENLEVPGTLFLANAPGSGQQLDVDYHVKYSRPD